jgi:AAA ATPase domain
MPRDLELVARVVPESFEEIPEQPSLLLRPEKQIIDFIGRRQELADLVAWCQGDTAKRLRLVTGPGGVGKTRLAIELCRRLSAEGWRCFEILDGGEANALEKIRESQPGRVLVVVDYAETRHGLKQFLREAVADKGNALRVLLLARSAGGWWEHLSGMDLGVRELISGAQYELGAVVDDQMSDAEIVRKAVVALGPRIGAEVREVTFVDGPKRARILDLLVAALAALLSAKDDGLSTLTPLRVELQESIPKLMEHEQRFWIGTAERA